MTVPANFSIVTLGVRDLDASARFYRALGWQQRGEESAGICWFKTSGSWVGLFGYDDLAADVGFVDPGEPADPASPPAYRGITLALNLPDRSDVDAAIAHAAEAGGSVVKQPRPTEWGGYSGYFADPDGHLWEVAHNPGFPIDETGRIEIA